MVDLRELAAALERDPVTAGVEVLALHGSRARGDAGPNSDWDFGYLAAPSAAVDAVALLARLTQLLGTDAVDVVDLDCASALLRYRVARDGRVVLERRPGAFVEFRLEATRFWCDAGPVIRAAQAEVLEELG